MFAIVCTFQQASQYVCIGNSKVDFIAYLVFNIALMKSKYVQRGKWRGFSGVFLW